jgi:hypothetical protein
VRLARPDVVSDCAHLLYFISQQAVESHACLEEADVAWPKADLSADLPSELSERLIVGSYSQFLVPRDELWVLLSVSSSEHFQLIIINPSNW